MKLRPKLAAPPALAIAAAVALTACSSGQELSYGEQASANDLDVTVLRVEQGSTADLAMLKDADKYADRTPYYVHYRVAKTTRGEVKSPDLDAVGDGGRLTQLNIMPSFPSPSVGADGKLTYSKAPKFDKCTDEHSYEEFNKAPKGESYEACTIYLTDAGDSAGPTQVEWADSGKSDPIATWK
ncbi:hypothetical protein ACX6XY_06925 [Streptomyces sp. O3]